MKRVGIYLRVSTNNGQTTDNQLRELEAVAKRSGWHEVEIFEDKGIAAPRGATSGSPSTGCLRPLPRARSTWSPHGRSTD